MPSLGEMGLNHFAPYIMNRIMARWNANLSEELRARDITTAKMRALAVLSVSSSLNHQRALRLRRHRTVDHEPHGGFAEEQG